MPRPSFTQEERLLINSVHGSYQNWHPILYLLAGSTSFCYGLYTESTTSLITGFGLVFGFKIYEMIEARRWAPIWKSVIEKFEAALGVTESDATNSPS